MENLSGGRDLRVEKPQPIFNVPVIIVCLLGSFVLVHGIRQFLDASADEWVLLRFAFTGARYVTAPELQGAIWPGGLGAQIWTFFTHMFLHGDWVHLAINGFWMLAFGSVVARRFGAVRFLLFSLVTAAFGALGNLLAYWGQFALMVGASGAISGHMAGAIRLMFSAPGGLANLQGGDFSNIKVLPLRHLIFIRSAVIFVGVWLGLNFIVGVSGFGTGANINRIAWEAHLGGFLSGLLLFSLFDRR